MEILPDVEALKLSNDCAAVEFKTAVPLQSNVENGKRVVEEEDEEELGEDDDIEDDDGDDYDEDADAEKGRVFSVGEFVWGKIKHHPWWPGQIYDATDASDLALKHKPKDNDVYLVAYFGDGTFSWCSGAQLKSFVENFELLSKQTSLKSFMYAVEDALSVFGEIVALEMTLNALVKNGESVDVLVKPVAENAGVRKGVLVPMVGVMNLAVAQIDAAEIIACVRNSAQYISVKNGLEHTMLKSKLLAFYRTKGYSELPEYHFPMHVVGLEDLNTNDNNAPQGGLVSNKDCQMTLGCSSEKANAVQEDKLYIRRKRKSLADIIREETDTDMQKGQGDEETPLKSRGPKRKKSAGQRQTQFEDKSGQSTLSKGKKRAMPSQKTKSKKVIEGQNVGNADSISVDDNDQPDNVEVNVASRTKGKKRATASTDDNDRTPAKSREKKKNRDSPKSMASVKHLGFEQVVLDIHTNTKVGERMSKAAKLIIESPPIKKQCLSIDSMTTDKLSKNSSAAVSPLHERPTGSKLGVLSSSKSSNYDMDEEYNDDDDDDGKPMSAIIFLTFSGGASYPTKADLLAKYRQFGSLNEEETDIVPNSLTAQVVFIKKSEGERAFDEMVKMNTGESGVQYCIRYVPRVSKVPELHRNAPPKASAQSGQVNPVSVSYLKHKFETIISKLHDTEEETLSRELKIELHNELRNLLDLLGRDF